MVTVSSAKISVYYIIVTKYSSKKKNLFKHSRLNPLPPLEKNALTVILTVTVWIIVTMVIFFPFQNVRAARGLHALHSPSDPDDELHPQTESDARRWAKSRWLHHSRIGDRTKERVKREGWRKRQLLDSSMTLNESWTMALPRDLPPKRDSCARCCWDTTRRRALIGYINTAGQRRPRQPIRAQDL